MYCKSAIELCARVCTRCLIDRGSVHHIPMSLKQQPIEFRADHVKIQHRVRFGDGGRFSNLAGMQVHEVYITADHAVPCHVHVATRDMLTCVWSFETQSIFLFCEDGVAQRLEYKPREGQITRPLSLRLVNNLNTRLGVRDQEFPNGHFNDTAFVFFGHIGYECTQEMNADEKVRLCAGIVSLQSVRVKAYNAFTTFAGLCGVAFIDESVVEEEFPPTAVHKLTFEDGVCSHEHAVHVWAKGPIQQSFEPGGVATLSDAAGNQIRFQHCGAPGNGWDMCSLCVKDKSPVEGMDVNMPVCLTAPFQVAFPDTPFPGRAAEKRRLQFQERKAEYEKRKATEEAEAQSAPKEAHTAEPEDASLPPTQEA
jgi:hypothetical protein